MNAITILTRRSGASLLAAATLALLCSSAQAQFTLLSLPNLPTTTSFPSFQPDEMPDGRLLYGTKDSLFSQNTFGSTALSSFSNPQSWDPSYIDILDSTHAAIGRGTFGASAIYLFNPSNPSTSFTAIPGVTLQNYSLAYRDPGSLYVGGTNGTGGAHAISYVTTDGSTNKVIIDHAGAFSGGFAVDLAGNLYVANAENNNLYKFTPGQVAAAIANTALNLTDGVLLTTLRRTGSIAIDSLGRVWSAGYSPTSDGIDVYDPASQSTVNFTPAGANTNYVVSTFTTPGGSFVGFLNSPTGTSGAALTYGYATVQSVPEPAASALLVGALTLVACRRRERFCA